MQIGLLNHFEERCKKPYVLCQVSPFLFWLQGITRPFYAHWFHQGPMANSASISLSLPTSLNASVVTSNLACIQPHSSLYQTLRKGQRKG